ncbi:MAG: 50S ribosomal protein L35 [Deltaproteobacteria bacterium]|nr:50S ribosomal protein L35 [Deltaproteobacteria bacterium]
MPKMKSSRGAMKRFKVTATGKVKRRRSGKSHLLSSKGRKRKRRLRQAGLVSAQETKTIRKLIPYL